MVILFLSISSKVNFPNFSLPVYAAGPVKVLAENAPLKGPIFFSWEASRTISVYRTSGAAFELAEVVGGGGIGLLFCFVVILCEHRLHPDVHHDHVLDLVGGRRAGHDLWPL